MSKLPLACSALCAIAAAIWFSLWIHPQSPPLLASAYAGDTVTAPSTLDPESLMLHAPFGVPTADIIVDNGAAIVGYNLTTQQAAFVAFRVDPASRIQLARIPQLKRPTKFPIDRNGYVFEDYNGLRDLAGNGYDRGHLMPLSMFAQDHDRDGLPPFRDLDGNGRITTADRDRAPTRFVIDRDDYAAIKRANTMANIVPMHHAGVNNAPAPWAMQERNERDEADRPTAQPFFVIAGPVTTQSPVHITPTSTPIVVAPAFFRVLYRATPCANAPVDAIAFFFPHNRAPRGRPTDYMVSIDTLESLTGYNFFADVSENDIARIEREDPAPRLKAWPTF